MKTLNTLIDIDQFFEAIGKREEALLLLDYDGTLAPFKEERMQAYPYPGIKDRLSELMKLKKTRVIIISGRCLADLERLLDLPHLELWGSHGLERRLANGKRCNTETDLKLKEGLEKGKAACQSYANPKQCEIKPYGVALHWRGKSQADKEKCLQAIQPIWQEICSHYDLEIHPFDEGLELRPKGIGKGDVVRKLLKETPRNTTVAYLGDDLTDEEAFSALGTKGLKVLVRESLRATLADLWITPQELLAFFNQWIKAAHG